MAILLFLFSMLPSASAAKNGKAETPPGVFQGKGYYFSLPKQGTTTYRSELESGEGGEQVYVFPPAVAEKKLGELAPGKYGRLGIVKVEVVRPEKGEDVTLKSLEEQTVEDFRASGAKVQTTELNVLSLPGFYARVVGDEKFALYLLKGKENLYYITSGIEDRQALEVVRTFGEGVAPAPKAPETTRPADVFGGKKLGGVQDGFAPKGDYSQPNDYSSNKGFAKPDGYAKPDTFTSTGTYGR